MKKVFRRAWVGILAAAAVIVGACCTNKNAPKQNDDPINNEVNAKPTKSELTERIMAIREQIKKREMSCVYGSPEIIQQYGQETNRLRHEADSLQYILDHYDDK